MTPISITIHGRETSIRMQPELWQMLREIAAENGVHTYRLIEQIRDKKPPKSSLASAIRVFVARYLRDNPI
jgi:predicted DNA-binding ribbon-helix-helix protein